MQVQETLAEGLKREYRITVPAKDLDGRINTKLDEIKDKVKINGFRPGKVPAAHLKRLYGRSVFGEVLQELMTEANRQIVDEKNVKLAMQPKVSLPEDEKEVEEISEGRADLTYKVEMEVLPEIVVGDLKAIAIEKPVADVPDEEVQETLDRIVLQNATYEPKDGAAADKDKVVIDFVGSIDGVEFEGGKGEDHPLILGSGQFIPGFEEQLVGVKAGDAKDVKVSFPADYRATDLAGKEAVFKVNVKGIEAPKEAALDDEFAKQLGMESADKLKETVREQIASGYTQASRQRMKRSLLDALDATHKFELPPTLVEQDFANIWAQVEKELVTGGDKVREGKTDDQLKAEYRTISERRVRLGLLLAEIGEKNNIQVTNDEVTKAVVDRARQFPGQEQMVWEFYQKNAEALAELRAPIFEEKVVDYIVELAKVTEKKVSKDELFADPDEKAA